VLDIIRHASDTHGMASCIDKCKQLSARVGVRNVAATIDNG